jgi:hypothetical protein
MMDWGARSDEQIAALPLPAAAFARSYADLTSAP